MINKKYLLQKLQSGQDDTSNASTIWINRERVANHLTGHEPAPVQPIARPAMLCPKCGKKMVEKIAKGGKLVAGTPIWVYPDCLQCKSSFIVEQA